jgi:small subunit ribosomal protein S6
MPLYESTFITRQDISPADVEKIADTMAEVVTAEGGKVVKREYWGLRSLAYKINKNRKGHYIMFGLDAPAPAVKEMERKLSIHDDVVRQMTIRVANISEEPSAVLKQGTSSPREASGGRGRPFRADNISDDFEV